MTLDLRKVAPGDLESDAWARAARLYAAQMGQPLTLPAEAFRRFALALLEAVNAPQACTWLELPPFLWSEATYQRLRIVCADSLVLANLEHRIPARLFLFPYETNP